MMSLSRTSCNTMREQEAVNYLLRQYFAGLLAQRARLIDDRFRRFGMAFGLALVRSLCSISIPSRSRALHPIAISAISVRGSSTR